MVVRSTPQDPWRVIGQAENEESRVNVEVEVEVEAKGEPATTSTGEKRGRSPSPLEDGPQIKRARASPSAEVNGEQTDASLKEEESTAAQSKCLAPPLNEAAQRVLSLKLSSDATPDLEGAGDVFLTEGFRDRWCRCPTVSTSSQATHSHTHPEFHPCYSASHHWKRTHTYSKRKKRTNHPRIPTQVCIHFPSSSPSTPPTCTPP